MSPPTLAPSSPKSRQRRITVTPLTPSSFSEFGTAISPPFPSSLCLPPRSSSTIPVPAYPAHQPQAVLANQDSALRTSPISAFTNNYPNDQPGTPQMSMFSCFPRNLSGIGIQKSSGTTTFQVEILERHPFTTQTFAPLGLGASEIDTAFLVIVAPSLAGSVVAELSDGSSKTIHNPPDLSRLCAFIAKGDQAVTYGPGTWHAPMVVLGQRRVDLLVTQFVNGVAEDDCQEVLLGQNSVSVQLDGLEMDLGVGQKAKL